MNIEKIIRELARDNYYQSIYSLGKDLGIKLFENDRNLTRIQLLLITYLGIISNISMDVHMGEIGEIVLEKDVYIDSYLLYKQSVRKKEVEIIEKRKKSLDTEEKNKSDKVSLNKKKFVFTRPKRN